jgi:ATP-dependent RNA helicase MSS116
MFRSVKSFNTLKAFSVSSIQTSNIYCTSVPTRILKNNAPPLSRELQSTIQNWQKVQSESPAKYGTFTDVLLHKHTHKAISEDFGFREMSHVQQKVLSLKDSNEDLLVKAKTGTGKTLAFMVAAIEKVLKSNTNGFQGQLISILVLSPTRELAIQIATETAKLVKHHRLITHTAVGGMPRSKNMLTITNGKVDILVGTPGRLNDLMKEPSVRSKLKDLKVLIFDECDQLLDMGFQREIETIVDVLPKNRSTFMFSATLSDEIRSVASKSLKPGYVSMDLVPKNEVNTHMKIKQSYAITPFKDQLYLLWNIIKKHQEQTQDAKIILFFPATSVVQFTTDVLQSMGLDTLQIHSKMDQTKRVRVSDKFRKSRSSILCTTDVSARGVDYPGVTMVIQVGMPSNREQYIHRIGRTGRANKSGEAMLILSPFEEQYLGQVDDLPIRKNLDYVLSTNRDVKVTQDLERAVQSAGRDLHMKAFTGILGFHIANTKVSGMRKPTVVELSKSFCLGYLNLKEFPSISARTAQNMGVSARDGIVISGSVNSGSTYSRPENGHNMSVRERYDGPKSFGKFDKKAGASDQRRDALGSIRSKLGSTDWNSKSRDVRGTSSDRKSKKFNSF